MCVKIHPLVFRHEIDPHRSKKKEFYISVFIVSTIGELSEELK